MAHETRRDQTDIAVPRFYILIIERKQLFLREITITSKAKVNEHQE
jgi:hypothetical protein